MPETVGHNVWSKEIKGSRESGSMMKTKFRVYMGHVLHRIKLGAGCGRLTARAEEDSLHMALFAEQFFHLLPLQLYDTWHEIALSINCSLKQYRKPTKIESG